MTHVVRPASCNRGLLAAQDKRVAPDARPLLLEMSRDGAEERHSSASSTSAGDDTTFQLVGKGGKAVKAKASGGKPSAPVDSGGVVATNPSPSATERRGQQYAEVVASGGTGKRPAIGPRSRSPASDSNAGVLDAIMQLSDRFGQLEARVGGIERAVEDGISDRGRRTDSDGSESTLDSGAESLSSDGDSNESPKSFLRVQADCGHWNARELTHDRDQEPHRYSLHGYEPYDVLVSGTRHGGSGTLGLGLRWNEPTCLYFKTGCDGLKNAIRLLDATRAGAGGRLRDELGDVREEFVACLNTLKGAYTMANTYRTLLVERAKVLSSGAKKGDKRRAEWVEDRIDGETYSAPDTAKEVRDLKAQYDAEADRADLKRAAYQGGAAAGDRVDRHNDDRGRSGKTKTQKRRERRERQRDGDDNARGGKRDASGGRRDERPERTAGRRNERPERGVRAKAASGRRDDRQGREQARGGGRQEQHRSRDDSAASRGGDKKGGGYGKPDDGSSRRGGGGKGRRVTERASSRGSSGRSSGSESEGSW